MVNWTVKIYNPDDVGRIYFNGNLIQFGGASYVTYSLAHGSSFTVRYENLDPDYSFDYWVERTMDYGDLTSTDNPYTIPFLDGNDEIWVNVKQARFQVVLASSNNAYGTVSPGSVSNVQDGTTVGVSGNILTIGGTTVTATPAADTAEYDYQFTGWSVSDGYTITTNMTITAYFTRTVRNYTVTWKNYDDTTLQTDTVAYGTIPIYTGPQPTKPNSGGYSYVFSKWTPNITPVAGNQTYTAEFIEKQTYNGIVLPVGGGTTETAEITARKPKWMRWTGSNSMGGNAELPSGHRLMTFYDPTPGTGGRKANEYYVYPVTLPPTDAEWRAVIYNANGGMLTSTGLGGIPTIGTPFVRLAENAPAKAVVRFPIMEGADNILSPLFAKWSDGGTGAVERGMEITVEYRRPTGELALVFRGMIYQVDRGDAEITVTAYDRVMDLYQFSDQYQSHQGYAEETLNCASFDGSQFKYYAGSEIGTVSSVTATNIIGIGALDDMHERGGDHKGYIIIHDLPHYNTEEPAQGCKITKVSTKGFITYVKPPGQLIPVPQILIMQVFLFRKSGSTFTRVASTSTSVTPIVTGSSIPTASWSVNWTIEGNPADYYIGAKYTADGYSNLNGYCGSDTRYTTSEYWRSDDDGATWQFCPLPDYLPEIAIEYTETQNVSPSYVTHTRNELDIATAGIKNLLGPYATTPDRAVSVDVAYFTNGGATMEGIVRDLIEAAGLVPNIDGSINMGVTDFYTSSTFDYLACIQELIAGGNVGLRMPVSEPGRIDILPRHKVSDSEVVAFTTSPMGTEQAITAHNLTSHWMAEKATVAMLAENATQSRLPIALETDDELMEGSLTKALQSPLRGISTDNTMGTHTLMAYSAGGKIRQLHTNIVEGEIAVTGYRSEIWDLDGNYAGGKTIKVTVPEAGIDSKAVPTAVEFADGITRITLDNIRRNERSELARSMGLTADNVSNESRQIPSTCWIFAKVNSYATQQTGIPLASVTKVECLLDDGTAVASQTDGNYIKTLTDPAGYAHVCAVFSESSVGYSPSAPITMVAVTMNGTVYRAVLENGKYALGGQAIHVDVRFRPSS